MERLWGLMPSYKVEKYISFKDRNDLSINIEAGPEGWTIMYADLSNEYSDNIASTEENFKSAYDYANSKFGPLREVTSDSSMEVENN